MALSEDQLAIAMVTILKGFSSNPSSVNENTVHETVLGNDGAGTATSKRIYKSFVRWTLINNGNGDPPWPSNWMKLTVRQLANKLIAV